MGVTTSESQIKTRKVALATSPLHPFQEAYQISKSSETVLHSLFFRFEISEKELAIDDVGAFLDV